MLKLKNCLTSTWNGSSVVMTINCLTGRVSCNKQTNTVREDNITYRSIVSNLIAASTAEIMLLKRYISSINNHSKVAKFHRILQL